MKEGMRNIIRILNNRAQNMRDLFFDFLFPAECLGCGQSGSWACKKCLKKIDFWPEVQCVNCGKKVENFSLCPECQKHFQLKGLLIAGNYDNRFLSEMIKAFKYRFHRDLANTLARFLARYWRNQANKAIYTKAKGPFLKNENIVLIPVPLHKRRQNWRGFNQSEDLSEKLAKIIGLDCNCKILKRIKYQKPQAKLTAARRRKNIIGCFAWRSERELRGKIVILIDDVTTTVATLGECAKVLKNNGAREVWGLVLAKGLNNKRSGNITASFITEN